MWCKAISNSGPQPQHPERAELTDRRVFELVRNCLEALAFKRRSLAKCARLDSRALRRPPAGRASRRWAGHDWAEQSRRVLIKPSALLVSLYRAESERYSATTWPRRVGAGTREKIAKFAVPRGDQLSKELCASLQASYTPLWLRSTALGAHTSSL